MNSDRRTSSCDSADSSTTIPATDDFSDGNLITTPEITLNWENFTDLTQEDQRRNTFLGWPIPHVSANDLASTGFVCLRDGDLVQCIYCNGIAGEWEQGDIPSVEHQRLFPDCPFLKGDNVGNILVSNEQSVSTEVSDSASFHVGEDVTDGQSDQQMNGKFSPTGELNPEDRSAATDINDSSAISQQVAGLNSQEKRNTSHQFVYEAERLNTFSDWTSPFVSTVDLASAGFICLHYKDHVQCAFCDGIVGEWEKGDIPKIDHKRLFPNCPFLKGEDVGNVPITYGGSLPEVESEFSSLRVGEDVADGPVNRQLKTNSSQIGVSKEDRHPSTDINDSRSILQQNLEEIETTSKLLNETERLKTFSNWATPFVGAVALAKAAFVSLHNLDHVQCVFCGGIIGNWEEGDIPGAEHKRLFPNCSFMNGDDVGNIPNHDHLSSEEEVDIDVYDFHLPTTSESQSAENLVPDQLEEGKLQTGSPKHPNYATIQKRLESFKEWPPNIPQNPRVLAAAGLYYAGISDYVNCFSCDIGIRNWEEEDKAWLLHARLFPDCPFMMALFTNIQKSVSEDAVAKAGSDEELSDDLIFKTATKDFQSLTDDSLYDACIAVENRSDKSDEEEEELSEN